MKVSIGCDHGAFELKAILVEHLSKEHSVLDRGTDSRESVDYPDFADKVTADLLSGEADRGILLCTTGIGMSIAANKKKGIRAALVSNSDVAAMSRRHNDANVLCLGSKYTSSKAAIDWTDIFLSTPFDGGRHQSRLKKIS